ncbi:UvrD-helicase domain-containing protein [Macrococcus equi]|uniref:UvrD-helicase domain-containing protein n=1 Tax=Macrococcus equi TaxID=3395462 RepID=UPI0039BDC558
MRNKVEYKPTPQQQFAAEAYGNAVDIDCAVKYDNILVSAGAGSGKTKVLENRVMNNIENNIGIDEMLIVTFTNEAAKNMKVRIENLLDESNKNYSNETNKYKQAIDYINNAQISTLHSFCLDVIEKHYHKLGLSPKLRSLEEVEREVILESIIEDYLEEIYCGEKNDLLNLVNLISISSRKSVIETIKNAINIILATPEKKIDDVLSEDILYIELLKEIEKELVRYEIYLNEVVDKIFEEEYFKATELYRTYYEPEQKFSLKLFKEISEKRPKNLSKEEILYAILQKIYREFIILYNNKKVITNSLNKAFLEEGECLGKFSKISLTGNKNYISKFQEKYTSFNREKYSNLNTFIKDNNFSNEVNKLTEKFISIKDYRDETNIINDNKTLFNKLIINIIRDFEEYKKSHNLIDFTDYEHYTLKLLKDEEVQAYYFHRFKEIMIDEYQDFNRVQEEIVRLIRTGQNEEKRTVFMVGDIKQSIYQFRQADPSIFNDKHSNAIPYSNFDKDKDVYVQAEFKGDGLDPDFASDMNVKNIVIELNKNFRSSKSVIELTNRIFSEIMTKKQGDVDYELGGHALIQGSDDYTSKSYLYNINVLDHENKPLDKFDSYKVTAQFIVEKINHLMKEDNTLTYSDFAILTSSRQNHQHYSKALFNANIPNLMNTRKGFLESLEIGVVLSVLRALDNPLQDVDLVSMMRLPIFDFSVKDIATIKNPDNYSHYLYSIYDYLNKPEDKVDMALKNKLIYFKDQLNELRRFARSREVVEVLREIYQKLEIEVFFTSMNSSENRKANLTGLIDKAIEFKLQGHQSIHEFIVAMEQLKVREKDFGEESFASDEDAVKIMTIHTSKGLEFKYVIYAEVEKGFNMTSAQGHIVIDPKIGIGMDIPISQPEYELYGYKTSFANSRIKERIKSSLLGEELRKMYVAFTRAKSGLIIPLINSSKDKSGYEKTDTEDINNSEDKVINYITNNLDKITVDELNNIIVLEQIDIMLNDNNDESEFNNNFINSLLDLERSEKINVLDQEYFNFYYDKNELPDIKKVSVTELKRESQLMNNEDGVNEKSFIQFSRPVNPLEETEEYGMQIGTLVHELMMRAVNKYKVIENPDDIEKIVNEAFNEVIKSNTNIGASLSKKHFDNAVEFFNNDKVKEMLVSKELFTEQPFFASYEIINNGSDESLVNENHKNSLFEGIIDLLIQKDDKFIVLDYKTDQARTPNDNNELYEKYKVQLKLYKEVVKNITGCNNVEAYLYGFNYDDKLIEIY